jgi:hypothetical protein
MTASLGTFGASGTNTIPQDFTHKIRQNSTKSDIFDPIRVPILTFARPAREQFKMHLNDAVHVVGNFMFCSGG